MYSLAVVVDSQNHLFLSVFLKRNCNQLQIDEVPLISIVAHPLNGNLLKRLRIARNIKHWVSQNNNYDGVLILSDYNYAYRTLVHYCRCNKKPIFLYQDGFIFFEPWPKTFSGIFKTVIYQGIKALGFSHLISYQSFHTNPNLVFSWGGYFSRTFKSITSSEIVSIGCLMYEKDFKKFQIEEFLDNVILYYGTFYRDIAKDRMAKIEAINNLKSLIQNEDNITCDIKLHPLDKNRHYLEQLLQNNSLNSRVSILGNKFSLSENIIKYKYIISEFSSETIFASIFYGNIYFIKNQLNEKHFQVLKSFLIKRRIGSNNYFIINQDLIKTFKAEFFQNFNVAQFEQAIQKYN